ncbi:MAG TPA: prepilin-type N-terminal cleavage/methylation domain-containing protein [Candidatus Paceibacterota bacterium]|nr:prepilin-type N-terminal cleavage/methylation domain-containing protein [Candidatus Paceibacterota bacterium]
MKYFLKKILKKAVSAQIRNETEDRRGFSIIETLVAVTIASLALASFSASVVLSIRGYKASREYYTAAKIAQEGMEIVINKRDANLRCVAIANSGGTPCPISDYQQNLINDDGSDGDWEVDAVTYPTMGIATKFNKFNPNDYLCVTPPVPPNDPGGRYGYNCGAGSTPIPGNFTREVKIHKIDSTKLHVTTIVRWTSQGQSKQIALEEVLLGSP